MFKGCLVTLFRRISHAARVRFEDPGCGFVLALAPRAFLRAGFPVSLPQQMKKQHFQIPIRAEFRSGVATLWSHCKCYNYLFFFYFILTFKHGLARVSRSCRVQTVPGTSSRADPIWREKSVIVFARFPRWTGGLSWWWQGKSSGKILKTKLNQIAFSSWRKSNWFINLDSFLQSRKIKIA